MGWQASLTFSILLYAVLLGSEALSSRVPSRTCFRPPCVRCEHSVYNYTLPDLLETRNISLSEYQGKVLLIVNVATYWGFTWHYLQLNALKMSYGDRLIVLGMPCNQFGKQEPGGDGNEIWNGIQHVRPGGGFLPNFQLFGKIEVNGLNEHPLYQFIKGFCPSTREEFADQKKLFYTPMKVRDIRWNFEKILIDATGMPVTRYDPSTQPSDIAKDIDKLMEHQG